MRDPLTLVSVVVIAFVIAHRPAQIKYSVIDQSEIAVIARCDVERSDAVLNTIQIHLHDRRRFWFILLRLSFLVLRAALVIGLLLACSCLLLFLLFFFLLLFAFLADLITPRC